MVIVAVTDDCVLEGDIRYLGCMIVFMFIASVCRATDKHALYPSQLLIDLGYQGINRHDAFAGPRGNRATRSSFHQILPILFVKMYADVHR